MADSPETTGGTGSAKVHRDRKRDARLVLVGVATVLLVWFAIANLQTVEIHFWVFTTHASLIAVVAIAGVLGALLALAVMRRRKPADG